MSDHKIDAGFLSRLQAARIAAREEVQGSSYYGFDPERRMSSFADSIENGLGGDVGKFLGMLDPDTVSRLVNELAYAMRSLKHVHRLTEHAINFDPEIAPVALPTECVESFGTPESALAKILKCDSAVVIPNPDANLKARVGELERENADLKEQRDDYQSAYRTAADTNRQWEKTSETFAKDRDAEKERADALQVEIENYTEANQSLTKAIEKWVESNAALTQQRDAILGRIIDWENAYRDGRTFGGGDLVSRVSDLINGYGSLHQSVVNANTVLKSQNDELDAFRELGASPEAAELLREVDVLGAYLKYPAREAEAETRLEIVKAALTKIEEQDELIGTLQRALVAAQNGQPRRPTGAQGWSEGITENHPIMTWFEKEFVKRLCADLDLDLDKMRRLFDKK